jgi:DUF1365 family protein
MSPMSFLQPGAPLGGGGAATRRQAQARATHAERASASATPMIAHGVVHHQRLRPALHRFTHRVFFLMLPMRTLATNPELLRIPRNRLGLVSFHDSDHGDGGPDCQAWLLSLLHEQGIMDADGEIWLQTFPRVLGYVFNPVSFWYCHRADGTLCAILAEVNNTFGERHCYLLTSASQDGVQGTLVWGQELRASKVFHVSPFCAVEGTYRFRFLRRHRVAPQGHSELGLERMVARIDHDDAQGPLVLTSISGVLRPLTRASARAAVLAHPFMTLGVMAGIHWQAFKLWRKRVPFHSKPAAPQSEVTR